MNNACSEGQQCLLGFKNGYCGLSGCSRDSDCPTGSACVTEQVANQDGGVNSSNFCFLVCSAKADCNTNRPVEGEANCSSTAVFVEGANGRKACVPPSGG